VAHICHPLANVGLFGCVFQLFDLRPTPLVCERAEDWEWSSFRHYAAGCSGIAPLKQKMLEWATSRGNTFQNTLIGNG